MGFKKLRVWQGSFALSVQVMRLAKGCTDFAFADQIKRCSVSVPSNIAEGMCRDSRLEKCRFLNIARASNAELETQLLLAKKVGYFEHATCDKLIADVKKINYQLLYLQRKIAPTSGQSPR